MIWGKLPEPVAYVLRGSALSPAAARVAVALSMRPSAAPRVLRADTGLGRSTVFAALRELRPWLSRFGHGWWCWSVAALRRWVRVTRDDLVGLASAGADVCRVWAWRLVHLEGVQRRESLVFDVGAVASWTGLSRSRVLRALVGAPGRAGALLVGLLRVVAGRVLGWRCRLDACGQPRTDPSLDCRVGLSCAGAESLLSLFQIRSDRRKVILVDELRPWVLSTLACAPGLAEVKAAKDWLAAGRAPDRHGREPWSLSIVSRLLWLLWRERSADLRRIEVGSLRVQAARLAGRSRSVVEAWITAGELNRAARAARRWYRGGDETEIDRLVRARRVDAVGGGGPSADDGGGSGGSLGSAQARRSAGRASGGRVDLPGLRDGDELSRAIDLPVVRVDVGSGDPASGRSVGNGGDGGDDDRQRAARTGAIGAADFGGGGGVAGGDKNAVGVFAVSPAVRGSRRGSLHGDPSIGGARRRPGQADRGQREYADVDPAGAARPGRRGGRSGARDRIAGRLKGAIVESFEWIAAVAQLGGGACALAAIWMFRPLIERFMGALEASQGRIDEAAALVHRSRESVDQLESTIAALPDRMREAMDRRIDSHSVACGNRRAGETELERLRRLG